MTANLKTEEIPAGGIADFVMTDEQIERLETEELQEQFGTNGIAQFSDVGKKMANFGRYGDDTVAHVETGELIVPRALIEKNPELKESIFKHLRELGVEDPERYVVGEVKNSVNPTTGLPEFFFKKLFKSVSKIAKGVGKALKKAAPLIIPMALNYFAPGLGQVYSAALGAGIGTLVQGGTIKDAFKSALVGGATGALTAGFSGPKSGIGGFGENIAADVSMGTSNIGNAFSQGSFAPLQNTSVPSLRDLVEPKTDSTTLYDGTKAENMYPDVKNYSVKAKKPVTMGETLKKVGPVESFKQGEYVDAFTGGKKFSAIDVLKAQNPKIDLSTLSKDSVLYQEALKKAAELSPGVIGKYGPLLAAGTAVGAATGFFDAPEEEEGDPARTGMDVYDENPDIYNVANLEPIYIEGDPTVDSKYPYYRPKIPFDPPVFTQNVAEGGEIFPRRVGGIMPDEGIPNKDSVRAMLMPGEFVMTTDAVKGLGGGDMNKGINNMYSVMRNLEQRGKAMA